MTDLQSLIKTNSQRLDRAASSEQKTQEATTLNYLLSNSLILKKRPKNNSELCQHFVDFLNVVLDLKNNSYRTYTESWIISGWRPYRKPNDTPLYINNRGR